MPIQSKQQPPYYQEGTKVKQYTAKINQAGTNAPIPKIRLNTTGQTLTYARTAQGTYTITSVGLFEYDKLFIPAYLEANVGGWIDQANDVRYTLSRSNDNTLTLITYEAGIPTDDWLSEFPIEFYIYNT